MNPETARLELFVGPWSVTETHYDVRGEVIGTVKGTEEVVWILDRRAIRRSYTTGSAPTLYRAIGTFAWNEGLRKYRGVWFDNTSTTGPTTVTGEWNQDTRTFVFDMEALNKDGSTSRYRIVEEFTDEEHRTATTYLLKGGEVIKQLAVHYERTVPCPSGIRVIFDGLGPSRKRPEPETHRP